MKTWRSAAEAKERRTEFFQCEQQVINAAMSWWRLRGYPAARYDAYDALHGSEVDLEMACNLLETERQK